MNLATADLYDAHEGKVQVGEPCLRDYGGNSRFYGEVRTLKVFEDNSLVRRNLEQPGLGRVLVVDGGGSTRCALLGDLLGVLAVDNGWSGIILNGCVRDSKALACLPLGVKALATNPRKSVKKGQGQEGVEVEFAALNFRPGQWVYCDEDGILLSSTRLH
ncbi:ribonuclease E activity regulator RraA [bacterium]|nr:ribonuclease E activity regulator RraA [bacterium]